jgi:Ca2+-binding RTX toxin-like protein
MQRQRAFLVALVIGGSMAAGLVAGSVWAATIVGTSRSDVLRGTAKADKLYGKAGNDKLYGRGGNDLLVGGPGADRFFCGPGRDIVVADAKDTVGSDCEIVRGLPKPPPPPTPLPPPAPPPPPAPTAQAGHYCGFTNNGFGICFDVSAGGKAFTNAIFGFRSNCTPDGAVSGDLTTSGDTPIKPDLTFDFEATSGDFAGSYIKGKLDAAGNASGVVHIVVEFDYNGTHYSCPFDTEWTAKRS